MAETKQISLAAYFQAVENRLERHFPAPRCRRIQIYGSTIEIRTYGAPVEALDELSLIHDRTDVSKEADAVFYCWDDTEIHCLSDWKNPDKDIATGVWKRRDNSGEVFMEPATGCMYGRTYSCRHFYWCRASSQRNDWMYLGKQMAPLFSTWADTAGFIMLHAAAVGVNGKGILLAGLSGQGKSTLSISCLLDGMDFIADDYVLIPAKGEVRAMPLYRHAGIHMDMLNKLPLPPHVTICPDANVDGKSQLNFGNQDFCASLPIRAIVRPVVTGCAEPVIQRVAPGPVLTVLVYSSAAQGKRNQDFQFIRSTIRRLEQLPVYEIQVSPDLMKNPQRLRTLIEEEL